MGASTRRGGVVGTARAAPAAGLALLVAAAVTSCTGAGRDGAPAAGAKPPQVITAEAFLAAWAQGRSADAAALTDDPAQAQPLLDEVRRTLKVTAMATRLGALSPAPTSAAYDVTMTLAGLGDWSYAGSLPLVEVDSGGQRSWRVDWSPAVVHPMLTADTELARTRALPVRASILDRDGTALTEPRPVVAVGVQPGRLGDPERAYDALARVDVDTAALAKRVAAAGPEEFVPAIVLRREEFAKHERLLRPIPGVVFRAQTRTLAPTAAFGRALLGTVAPATAETLDGAGPLATADDDVGASGLQEEFQEQLAGTPGGQVQLVRRDAAPGSAPVQPLHDFVVRTGQPLRTTLDDRVQAAAESAVAPMAKVTAVVALQPSTGEVLAAATSQRAGGNRAFTGRYPPGSTFKVVTTAALLSAGADPGRLVPCTPSVTVDGKDFGNYDELRALGDVPLRRAFVESCNTAFVAAAAPLPAAALPDAAARLGFGGPWDLGVPAFSGSLAPPEAAVDQAAASLGQGSVLASPLAMAAVAAAVQSGTPRAPVLLPGRAGAAPPPAPLPADLAATLRELMQQTVATGTARVLRLPGPPVGGKTGTAQYGDRVPPQEHAWMIGFRGDLAFAVLVEDGGRGSTVAGPVARAFLAALGDGAPGRVQPG